MPIGVLLALLAPLGVPYAIFSHCGPIITRTDYLRRQRASSHMTTADPLMKLCHYRRAQLSTHAHQDRVSETAEQLSIQEGVLLECMALN